MLFLYGETGDINHYKFSKKINGKQFFYTGTADHGVFIEEIVFNGLVKYNESFKDEIIQALVVLDEDVYFVNLNDNKENQFGESTISYSRIEFKDHEIMQFISDYIISNENIFFVEYKNNTFSFYRENGDIKFTFANEEIPSEKLISGTERIKGLIKENAILIGSISLTILIPLITLLPLQNKLNQLDTEIEQLKFEENKLIFDKKKKEIEITSTSKKYNQIDSIPDIFTDEKLMSEVLNLKITTVQNPTDTSTTIPQ